MDLTIAYSEKSDRLVITCETALEMRNPFEDEALSGDLGVMIVKNISERIDYRLDGGTNKLELTMKNDPRTASR